MARSPTFTVRVESVTHTFTAHVYERMWTSPSTYYDVYMGAVQCRITETGETKTISGGPVSFSLESGRTYTFRIDHWDTPYSWQFYIDRNYAHSFRYTHYPAGHPKAGQKEWVDF